MKNVHANIYVNKCYPVYTASVRECAWEKEKPSLQFMRVYIIWIKVTQCILCVRERKRNREYIFVCEENIYLLVIVYYFLVIWEWVCERDSVCISVRDFVCMRARAWKLKRRWVSTYEIVYIKFDIILCMYM